MSQKSLDDILPIELYRRFPKAELHRHLDGSVRPETIIELAREQGVELPSFDVAELRELICVKEDCPSLVEYLRGFDIALSVMQQKCNFLNRSNIIDAITRIMYEVCEDAAKDGVKYIEIRFSPILHTKMGLQLSSIMEAVIEGKVSAELKLNIVPRIIVSGMRQLPSSITKQLAEIAVRTK
jgi:adenosine deaminase